MVHVRYAHLMQGQAYSLLMIITLRDLAGFTDCYESDTSHTRRGTSTPIERLLGLCFMSLAANLEGYEHQNTLKRE
jgi:hypothetical protein